MHGPWDRRPGVARTYRVLKECRDDVGDLEAPAPRLRLQADAAWTSPPVRAAGPVDRFWSFRTCRVSSPRRLRIGMMACGHGHPEPGWKGHHMPDPMVPWTSQTRVPEGSARNERWRARRRIHGAHEVGTGAAPRGERQNRVPRPASQQLCAQPPMRSWQLRTRWAGPGMPDALREPRARGRSTRGS